jgi:hypothetical protein
MTRKSIVILLAAAVVFLSYCGEETPQAPENNDDNGGGVTGPDTIPPAAIEEIIVRYPSQQSVSLVWDAPGDDGDVGTATEYDIRFSLDSLSEDTWDTATQYGDEPAPKPCGSPETVRIGGLLSSHQYFFGIKTRDEVGNESDLSEVESATTLTEIQPPAPVTDLVAQAVDEDTYRLTWTAPGDDGVIGQATSYSVRHSRFPITSANWSRSTEVSNPPAPKPSGEIEVLDVDGLMGETNYYFAIKTADEVNNTSDMSNVAFAIGAEVELYVTPSPVHAGEELTVYWRSPGDQAVAIHVWRWYSSMYQCEVYGQNPWIYADLFNGVRKPEGMYSVTFDFKFPDGSYFPGEGYVIEMCWGNAMRDWAGVTFVND